jgi:hypothetical protein
MVSGSLPVLLTWWGEELFSWRGEDKNWQERVIVPSQRV